MNTTEEFIYKGIAHNIHERTVHLFRKEGENKTYYMFKLDSDLDIGQKVAINYTDVISYKKGIIIIRS